MRPLDRRTILLFILLWLAGNSLRFTVLAVPPLLPRIHAGLHLSEALVGALTGLPVLLLAAGAVFGSLLIAHLGPRRALLAGLVAIAAGGALRGAGPATPILFGATLLMGIGVAVSQPTLASLVRAWLPDRLGAGTALYANGILVGEILPASLTLPFVLPLLGSWERAIAFWSLPVLLTALAVFLFTPHVPRPQHVDTPRWVPDWRDARTWRLGLILGSAGASYFGANAFIPDYLKATGHTDVIPAALTSLNLAQFPSSLIVAAAPGAFIARRWPIFTAGVIGVVVTVLFAMGGSWVVLWAAMLGFTTALVFVLSLAIPPLVAGEHDVHRLMAGIFTIAYVCPFSASIVGGAIWDHTGAPLSAFIPVAAAGILMAVLVLGLDLSHARREHLGVDAPDEFAVM